MKELLTKLLELLVLIFGKKKPTPEEVTDEVDNQNSSVDDDIDSLFGND